MKKAVKIFTKMILYFKHTCTLVKDLFSKVKNIG